MFDRDAVSQALKRDIDVANLAESRLTLTTPPSVSPMASPSDEAPGLPRLPEGSASAPNLGHEPLDGSLTISMTESFTTHALEVGLQLGLVM